MKRLEVAFMGILNVPGGCFILSLLPRIAERHVSHGAFVSLAFLGVFGIIGGILCLVAASAGSCEDW